MNPQAYSQSSAAGDGAPIPLTRRLQALAASSDADDEPREPAVRDLDGVDGRLAAIEDTLGGFAERIEALTRDNAAKTAWQLDAIDARLATLTGVLQTEHSARERAENNLVVERRRMDRQLTGVRQAVSDGFAALSSQVATYQTSAVPDPAIARAHLEGLLASLRSEIGRALDETATRVDQSVGVAAESVAASLGEHRATSAQQGASVLAASSVLGDRVVAASAGLRDTVVALSETLQPIVTSTAGEAAAGHAGVTSLLELVTRLDGTVTSLHSDWQPKVESVVAQGHAAAHSVLEEVQDEVGSALAKVTIALTAQRAAIRDASGTLGGGTDRLVAAGEALLAYLAERDRLLEQERDQALHEVLDEFANGLSSRRRRAMSSRVGEALDRHRDARDADRFRSRNLAPPASVTPSVPAVLAELAPATGTGSDAVPATAVNPVPTVGPPPAAPGLVDPAVPPRAVPKPTTTRTAKNAKKPVTAAKKAAAAPVTPKPKPSRSSSQPVARRAPTPRRAASTATSASTSKRAAKPASSTAPKARKTAPTR